MPVLFDEFKARPCINGSEVNAFDINGGPAITSSHVDLEAHAAVRFVGNAGLRLSLRYDAPATVKIVGVAAFRKLFFGGDYGRRMRAPREVRTVRVPSHEKECASMSDCCLAVYDKDPGERLDYNIDFGPWLEVNDLLDVAVSVLENPDTAIVIDEIEVSRQVVRTWVSAGLDGDDSHIEVTATTLGGRVKKACFRIRIRECC